MIRIFEEYRRKLHFFHNCSIHDVVDLVDVGEVYSRARESDSEYIVVERDGMYIGFVKRGLLTCVDVEACISTTCGVLGCYLPTCGVMFLFYASPDALYSPHVLYRCGMFDRYFNICIVKIGDVETAHVGENARKLLRSLLIKCGGVCKV